MLIGFTEKMDDKVKLKKIFFLLMFFFCSVKANSFCPKDWVYHGHSGTCMRMIKETAAAKRLREASNSTYCERFTWGKDQQTKGHLVYILDKETEDFVSELLNEENLPSALIGSTYRYLLGRTPPAKLKISGGKNKTKGNYSVAYICEVDAAISLPKLTCPPLLINKTSSDLVCSIESPPLSDVSWIEFGKSDDTKIKCQNAKCDDTNRLTATVTVKQSLNVYNVSIKNVEETDGAKWTCTVKFEGFPRPVEATCDVKVYDPDEYCSPSESNQEFKIPLNREGTVTLCIIANGEPTKFRLLKTEKGFANANKYNVSFKYINERRTKAKITLTVRNFTESELGHYQLLMLSEDNFHGVILSFKLMAAENPECPKNFQATTVHSHFVTLSWTPGFDGGSPQTFTILMAKTLSELDTEATLNNGISVEDSKEDEIIFNATGLSASTAYFFSIEVRNAKEHTKCPALRLNVSTMGLALPSVGQEADGGGGHVTGITVAIIVVLAVIAVIEFIVIVTLRRRKKYIKENEGAHNLCYTDSVNGGSEGNVSVQELPSLAKTPRSGYKNLYEDL